MNSEASTKTRVRCPSCHEKGKPVGPATLGALLKEEFAQSFVGAEGACCASDGGLSSGVGENSWRFCPSQRCDVVYFAEESETMFSKSQLKVPVGVKEAAGERPLCYCFGHSVGSIKQELQFKGRSEAPQDIRRKMKDPGCQCETTNPSGSCCLGSVTKGIEIAQEEMGMTTASTATEPVQTAKDTPSSPISSPPTGRGEKAAKIGTVLSAIVASACCWLPLVLLAIGVSGVGIAAILETYRPLFIVVTFGFLAAAFYFTYRPKKSAPDAGDGCCPPEPSARGDAQADCCAPAKKSRFSIMAMNKVMLWAVTVLAVAFLLFPHYVGAFLGTSSGPFAVVTPDMKRAVLQIEGMTCEGCEAVAEKAIRTVPGVLAVEANYEEGKAVVGFDGSRDIPRDEIPAALEKVGYQSRFVKAPHSSERTNGKEASLSTVTLSISGMTCPTCAVSAQSALTKLPGVQSAHVDAKTGEAFVQFDAEQVRPEDLTRAVTDVEFESDVRIEENR